MRFLIVTAHPHESSYTAAVVERFSAGLRENGEHSCDVVDLLQEGFDPIFGKGDYDFYNGRGDVPSDVRAEQQRLDRADALVLIFPIYWWSMPAVMKGWIDRVFTTGWAFVDDPAKGTKRLLGHLEGHVLAIGGSYRRTYESRGYLAAMEKEILEGIFSYCGMRSRGMDLILPMDPESADAGLREAFDIGRSLAGDLGRRS